MPASTRLPVDRRRWTEADARVVLSALARSGQSVRAFAAEHGVDPQRVYVWRRRVAEGDRTTFREVVVRPTLASSESRFEVTLVSGICVRVPPSFDASSLTRLLEVLGKAPAC